MARQIQQSHRLNTRFGQHLRPLVIAISLGCAVVAPMAQAADEAAAVLQQSHSFDIPSQPLSAALISFGQQSGLQVTVDAALLADRVSNSVKGHLNSEQALALLLNNSGITWRYEDGNLLFERAPSSATGSPLELTSTVVLGEPTENSFQGATVINRKAIKAFPGSNGDITTLLRMHPSVQFSGSQQSSNTPGEIEPADISINGAKFYQNNFMIDGISINNDLDPGAHGYSETRVFDSSPSRAQGIALDADLLEEIRVYDSNVPAEYGGFNGGVVDAITRRPTEKLHGKFSYAMSRSEWTRYHISDDDRENFDNASNEQYQPEFSKTTVRGTLEGYVTDNFGAIVNFSQKRSEIPLNAYSDGYVSPTSDNQETQTRELDNYLVKTYWDINERLTLESSFTYAPAENYYFRENQKNSGFTTENGGVQGAFKATWLGDSATVEQKLALTDLTSSRDAEQDEIIAWYYSAEKNWGKPETTNSKSTEGAFGSLEQTEKGVDYSLKADLQPLSFAGMDHLLTSGTQLAYKKAHWGRDDDVTNYGTFTRDSGTSCNGDRLCSISPLLTGATRQWARSGVIYRAGDIDLTEKKYAFFGQDQIQIGQLGLRPGVRFEGDDYMEKKTIAPRFAGDYDLFGDRSTVLVFGANRYYGRNLFKYRLNDGRGALNTNISRTAIGAVWRETQQLSTNQFSTLDIPYDDEWTLGVDQRWLDTDFKLKYVHRTGKDKIIRTSARTLGLPTNGNYATTYYTYTNQGYSESDNLTLSVTPVHDFKFAGTRTSLQLAFDWSQTTDGYGNYDDILTADEYADDDVYYDGKLMNVSELPASDFNRPWTARLTAITEIPQWHLTISNFFRYRAAYEQIVDTGDDITIGDQDVSLYEVRDVSAAPTWDMRIDWEIPVAEEQALFVGVDVTNVTDHVNEIVSSSGSASYETGRSFWLEVGYRF